MEQPTVVSIIVPVYNVAPYIKRCIDSLLIQTYSKLEIILVDDGSSDGSGNICDAFAQKDHRIIVLHQSNQGVCAARNAGLAVVSGEYVGFVDPDDWVAPNMYQRLMKAIEGTGADAVFCGYWEKYFNPPYSILHSPQRQGKVDGEEALYQCLIGIGYGYFTSVWNKLFRRSSITKASGEILRFDESLAIGEDEVWLSSLLMKLRSIVLCPEPLYYWRQRETSVLHEIVIDQRWHSALKAKRIVLELVANSEKCRDMALGKVYDDLFHVLWYAYCCDDNEALAYFYDELRPFQKNFFANKAFSFKKKIRYLALLFMITFRFPRRTVQALGEVTSLKLRLARQSNIKF